MFETVKSWILPPADVPSFYPRVLWVVVRLIAAYLLANQVNPFFYQRF